jgi:hypothetical protein
MLIAYLSIDEVNQDLAARLCEAGGTRLEVVEPRDPPPDRRFDGVVYDLDCLAPEDRRRLVGELSAAPPPWPVAVHGYHLEDGQAAALRRNGVAIHRQLGRPVFDGLFSPAAVG